MSEQSAEVATQTERPASTAVIMSPAQYDSTWRMAKALTMSGSFKDIGRGPNMSKEVLEQEASKALARILLGADLGMTPTQALMGIDIVKGAPQIRGVALGRMVRQTAKMPTPTGESYDYAVLDRGFTVGEEFAVVALYRKDEDGAWPRVEDDEGETFPTSVGAVTVRKGHKLPEGVEAFKLEQAKKRDLVRGDGAWATHPEVMCVWRALSQLVRFYAPDVIGGTSVYTEADSFTETAAERVGATESANVAVSLPLMVEAVIARATELGHHGYANRAAVAMMVGGQPDIQMTEWCARAMGELEAYAAEQGEPTTDATVAEPAQATDDAMSQEDRKVKADSMRADADALRDEATSMDEDDPRDRDEMFSQANVIDALADKLDGTQGSLL